MKRSPIKRRAPLRKKGESSADALWRDARAATLERDGYECQGPARGLPGECQGRLHAHHVLRRSQGGQDHPANLIAICTWHHTLGGPRFSIHGNPARAYELGLLQRSGDTECSNCHHSARLHSVTYGRCTYGPESFGMECACQSFVERVA